MNTTVQPFIKWTGSKRSQAQRIVSEFPDNIGTYYEPFCGGCSVMHELLNQIYAGNKSCRRIVCSDINSDLIVIFKMLVDKVKRWELYDSYCDFRRQLVELSGYHGGEINRQHMSNCQSLYYSIRDEYNNIEHGTEYSAKLFFWLTRNAINGLIRYNRDGKFNSGFHIAGRLGITPEKLKNVFDSWTLVIDSFIDGGGTIEFINDSYDRVVCDAQRDDIVYMDPPYTGSNVLYFGQNIDLRKLITVMTTLKDNGAGVLLSFDGRSESSDRTADVGDWYVRHEYIESGISSFRKITGTNEKVFESLYISY